MGPHDIITIDVVVKGALFFELFNHACRLHVFNDEVFFISKAKSSYYNYVRTFMDFLAKLIDGGRVLLYDFCSP